MKKRRGLKAWIAILLVLSISLGATFAWLTLSVQAADQTFVSDRSLEDTLDELTSTHKEVTADQGGMVFINNEIIVLAELEATRRDMDILADNYSATISDAIEEAGIYQFRFSSSRELKEMRALARQLSAEATVETAYISPVSLSDTDDAPAPVIPSDPWKNAKWDVTIPRDANWSVEAINAPQAWGYLDQLSPVNIGLIDSMVNTDHPDLDIAGAFASYYDQVTGEWTTHQVNASVLKPQDHGTHVAGTMVATWNDQGMSGVMGGKGNLYYSQAYNTRNGSVTNVFYTPYTYVKAISVLLEQDVRAINISQHTNRLIGFAASHGNQNAVDYLQAQADLAESMLLRIIQKRQAQGEPDFVICMSAGNSNSTTYYPSENYTYGYTEFPSAWQKVNGTGVIGGSLAKYNNFLNLIDDETVAGRIIVVGAAAIDHRTSTGTETRYAYASYSNVGDRVDIVAPGSNVYSCLKNGHDYMTGTSMAAPHVTAAAGLIFGANPELSGPDVKAILTASTGHRFAYQGGESGMLDLAAAVEKGLLTLDKTVNQAINAGNGPESMDICFIVDTTSSMGDDIDNVRQNMKDILDSMEEKTEDFQVAVVDYRDFPDRADVDDYAAKVQLPFTKDREAITAAIDTLTLGYGGDWEETVYSGIMTALSLNWREDAHKVIIILGDAPALDPEPYTGYTYDQVLEALMDANIGFSGEDENPGDSLGSGEDFAPEQGSASGDEAPKKSDVQIYSVITDAKAESFFDDLSVDTGGEVTTVEDASEVAGAIQGSINKIEEKVVQSITVDFGKDFSGELVELYRGDEYQFSVQLDNEGKVALADMPIEQFNWKIFRLRRSGTMSVQEGSESPRLLYSPGGWDSFFHVVWQRHRTLLFWCVEGFLLSILTILVIAHVVLSLRDKRALALAQKQAVAREAAVPAVANEISLETEQQVFIPDESIKFCPHCGTKMAAEDMFCPNCGNRMEQ